MSTSDFSANLRLLCGYEKSITILCQKAGINRQQFYRYLNDLARPGFRTLTRLCDHFGLEELEIFLDHQQFRRMIALRKPLSHAIDPLADFILAAQRINPRSTRDLQEYLGYYFSYFSPAEFPNTIMRALVYIFAENGFVYSKNVEGYRSVKNRKTRSLKYTGILFHSGDKIFVHERERNVGKMIWTTVFQPAEIDQFSTLAGLTLGTTSGSGREVACYRIVWEYLGRKVDLRSALGACGLHARDDPRIGDSIRNAVVNDIRPGENGFLSRHWTGS